MKITVNIILKKFSISILEMTSYSIFLNALNACVNIVLKLSNGKHIANILSKILNDGVLKNDVYKYY